jgi:hypothetical protein
VLAVATEEQGAVEARLAPSCLVTPDVGDEVLYSWIDRRVLVLAITARESSSTTVSLQGDLRLELEGDLDITARRRVTLASAEEMTLVGPEVKVRANLASLFVRTLDVVGDVAQAELERVRVVASTMESIADRWVQHAKDALRLVRGVDQLRAERIDHAASSTASVRGKNALVTGEELVKMDAKQIHVG